MRENKFVKLKSTSSVTPLGWVMDLLTSYNDIFVGFSSYIPNFLNTNKGIKLMLAPKSQKALKQELSIEHGRVKLLDPTIWVATS